jgi:hypothetical protein
MLVLVLASAHAAEKSAPAKPQAAGTFQLKAADGAFTLKANEAPLAKVFEELGKQAGIAVESSISPEEKITIELDRVPLEDGIRQLTKNATVFYKKESGDKNPRIAKVVVLAERAASSAPSSRGPAPAQISKPAGTQPSPEPFTFNLDPSKLMDQDIRK